jgi:cohesin complex subunit SCC1
MFYSKFMFVKKGPLSKVWIAAHFQRKLTKTLVQGTDINISAKSILDPSTPLALRLSGQLLLGLVRIFQKKVRYLQEDCSEALTKMKMIFKPGAVDLPPESATAHSAQVLDHSYFLCSR